MGATECHANRSSRWNPKPWNKSLLSGENGWRQKRRYLRSCHTLNLPANKLRPHFGTLSLWRFC
uniref:Uncharacterized protein n=1 Tax=Physcomitrium patens TaxID=3218 RepID=A0A2K1J0E9_PHYPA|nr:hypothetical protein PHYPA_022897 [Physcomitrium patens]